VQPAKTETTIIPTDITNDFITVGKKNKTKNSTEGERSLQMQFKLTYELLCLFVAFQCDEYI
jgi:hypothetical protein